jgi:hypothetical protein
VPKPKLKASSTGGSRRDKLASFEAARKRDQRRRTAGLLAVCVVLALALLAYPVYLFVDDYQARSATLDDIGASVSAAGCDTPTEDPASGNQEHVADGTKVTYAEFPPAAGAHYATPAPFTKRFYTMADRPAVETLVHNLEHGYTLAWYRDTMPADEKDKLEQISKTFAGDDYTKDKFIAAPWSETDGAGFPAGKNVVLAHWYADPSAPADAARQKAVRQPCVLVSGPAVKEFMAKYPYTNSPEPNAA